ncbi:3-isopropylmalate dehydratase small subunit [Prauserella oleivorans]|uniref:3-isopropylmalate dehydratase small subunit n=1 Tax=Prauserella oleivorans TaxID=1478153 RepID=A0ABW5WE71_9PSEU
MPDPFVVVRSKAVPLLRSDIDTDSISPGTVRSERKTGQHFRERTESADDLFANWRYHADGSPRPDFVLNDPGYSGARILLTGDNFGCGSSRESAVWLLAAWGFRCIIAPSFAEIFLGNCYANGVLPLTLPTAVITRLADQARPRDDALFTVNLEDCCLTTPSGERIPFSLSGFRRRNLLEGLDAIQATMAEAESIKTFHVRARAQWPWLYPDVQVAGPTYGVDSIQQHND